MSSIVINLSEGEEVYKEKMNTAMDYCFDELVNDSNNEFCAVVMDWSFEKQVNVVKLVNTLDLCKLLFKLLRITKQYYDAKFDCLIELEEHVSVRSSNHPNLNALTFTNTCSNVVYRCRFITKDDITLSSIKSILNSCKSEKILKLCYDMVYNEDKMTEMWATMFGMEKRIMGFEETPREKIPREKKPKEETPKEETPKEKIPREEIPREKTLSKKEKEKLKKQKAKEANKLKQQEKKDKAKLAEQQAKQFEKQQKERNKKRIETERKKKLALLKK